MDNSINYNNSYGASNIVFAKGKHQVILLNNSLGHRLRPVNSIILENDVRKI